MLLMDAILLGSGSAVGSAAAATQTCSSPSMASTRRFLPCSSLLPVPVGFSVTFKHACPARKSVDSVLSSTTSFAIHRRSRSSSFVAKSGSSSSSESSAEDSKAAEKASFGYSRKDVLLIGLGVTLVGVGLKSGLEFVGVDPLQAGNVVQLVIVLGLTVGWISTYMFRVANKDMTYAQQLKDYENKVMEKRLESLSEAELQVLLEQVEEEKQRLARRKQMYKQGDS